jgi:SAM-dependent methyltransferase
MPIRGWSWDETLYAGSAPYYAVGRVPYPPEAAYALQKELALDGHGRLLDVGCGPGSLTMLLAPLFEEAVGVDPDPGMLDEALSKAPANTRWYRMRAEELPGDLGRFRVITFAQSFHWMDQPRVASAVKTMLEPGGACVLVGATTHQGLPGSDPLARPRPPWDGIEALITRCLGPVLRAGQGTREDGTPGGEGEVMRAAGFHRTAEFEVGGRVVNRSEDEIVASVFSLSYAAPHLFGERLAQFERDLRTLLRATAPDGRFSERMREMTLTVWRP